MQRFELILVLLAAMVASTALSRRLGAPYPALLALMGAVLVFLPGMPHIQLEPQLTLALLVAPVLLDAAFDSSPRDLRRSWRPITALVVGAVCATVVAVAAVAHALVPALPWPAAIALGAIVAPPDAAAAAAVLKQVPPPSRILRVLEGESLLNDVTALLIYRLAVVAQSGEDFRPATAGWVLGAVVVGSWVLGRAFAWIVTTVMRGVDDAPSSIVMQFVWTFGVWIAAERLGASGILTMVVYAMAIASRSGRTMPARVRLPSYAVWETVVFVLNGMAFVLIGLQLGPILDRLAAAQRLEYLVVALAVLATCVIVRFAWIAVYALVARGRSADALPRKAGIVVAWSGMRGIVTLATAIALPPGFPARDLVLLTAFVVVLGTLVLQGLTLGPMLRRFALRDDGLVEREVALAREAVRGAARRQLESDGSAVALALIRRDDDVAAQALAETARVKRGAFDAARAALDELRDADTIGNDAFRTVLLELDQSELALEARAR